MILCDCGWKYPKDSKECPACGNPNPSGNSESKSLKEVMKDKGRQHLKENGGRAVCENCGLSLPRLRYSNVSHKKKRSTNPQLRKAISNLEILCSGENFWGKKDKSCHSVWEVNDFEKFKSLKDSRKGQKGT